MCKKDQLLVTVRHARKAGYCLSPGVRVFLTRHGLDYRQFVRGGLPADVLLATGDAMAQRVVAIAREEETHGR